MRWSQSSQTKNLKYLVVSKPQHFQHLETGNCLQQVLTLINRVKSILRHEIGCVHYLLSEGEKQLPAITRCICLIL